MNINLAIRVVERILTWQVGVSLYARILRSYNFPNLEKKLTSFRSCQYSLNPDLEAWGGGSGTLFCIMKKSFPFS